MNELPLQHLEVASTPEGETTGHLGCPIYLGHVERKRASGREALPSSQREVPRSRWLRSGGWGHERTQHRPRRRFEVNVGSIACTQSQVSSYRGQVWSFNFQSELYFMLSRLSSGLQIHNLPRPLKESEGYNRSGWEPH